MNMKNIPKMFSATDFVLRKSKIAIFCDSEFWHGYRMDSKKLSKLPLAVPRIEILVPYTDLDFEKDSPGPIKKKELEYISHLLGAIFHEGVLDYYHDELNPMGKNPTIFLAPRPVVEAHDSCKMIAQVYKDDFLELLIQEARAYWFELRRSRLAGAT